MACLALYMDDLIRPLQQTYEGGSIIIPVFQMRKLRLEKINNSLVNCRSDFKALSYAVSCQPVGVAHGVLVLHTTKCDSVHLHMGPRGCYAHMHVCGPVYACSGRLWRELPPRFWVCLVHTPSSAAETFPSRCSLVTSFLNEKFSEQDWLSRSGEACTLGGFGR